mgnify:CR=1 FL=1
MARLAGSRAICSAAIIIGEEVHKGPALVGLLAVDAVGALDRIAPGLGNFARQNAAPALVAAFAVGADEGRRVAGDGVTTQMYFYKTPDMAQAYGEEFGKAMNYFTGVFGLPLRKDLTVVETDNGTPNGYAAPGVVLLQLGATDCEVQPFMSMKHGGPPALEGSQPTTRSIRASRVAA